MVLVFVLIWVSSVFAAKENLIFSASFDKDLDKKVKDLSQYGNDGEFFGNAQWSAKGKYGGCAEILGAGGHVSIEHNDLFNITETVTLEAWVNPTPEAKWGIIIGKKENYQFWFLSDGEIRLADDMGEKLDTLGYNFRANEWVHVAGVLDTVTPQRVIYINGEEEAGDKVAFGLDPTGHPLRIGFDPGGAIQYIGLIDEVQVWNVVRTPDEIKQDMEFKPKAVFAADKLAITWGQLKMQ
jgi:hypothetical protein